MNSYHIRSMSEEEHSLYREHCFSEGKLRTICKVSGEQYLLWLFPMVVVVVVLGMIYENINIKIYIITAYVYLIIAGLVTALRYFKERRTVEAMQEQSNAIYNEFEKRKVESCDLHINCAYLLEEEEDEGPTFVLEVDDENIILLSEHGNYQVDSLVPGDHVEVIRLPESKKVIAKYWSGTPISIKKIISRQYINVDWIEGEFINRPSNLNL